MKKEWKNPNFSVLGIEWTKDFPSVRMPSGTNLPGTVQCTYPGCNQSKYVRNEDEYNEFVNNHSTIHSGANIDWGFNYRHELLS